MKPLWIFLAGVTVVAMVLGAAPESALAQNQYQGFKFVLNRPGYDRASCIIETKNPTVSSDVSAWVGLDNAQIGGWIWMQTGWGKNGASGPVEMYYEYTDENGGYSGIINQGAPGAGGKLYAVKRNGTTVDLICDNAVVNTVQWSDFDRVPLCGAQFGAEMHGGSGDYTPGSVSNPCDFSSATLRQVGGSDASAGFGSAGQLDSHPDGRVSSGSTGAFYIWDSRVQ